MQKIINGEIITNTPINVDHYLMDIEIPISAIPGQFVMVKISDNTTDPLLRIPLGIHSINKNGISLLYKIRGKGTQLLSARKPGEKINIVGPLGNGFNINIKPTKTLLVAGGYGVSPLYALAELLISQEKTVTVCIGAATKSQIIGAKEFAKLGAKVYIATEDGSEGFKGLVIKLVQQHLHHNVMIYGCGPEPMLRVLAQMAVKANIPAQLSLEAYMACGIGVCRGCAVDTKDGYKICCKDGPIFDAEMLI